MDVNPSLRDLSARVPTLLQAQRWAPELPAAAATAACCLLSVTAAHYRCLLQVLLLPERVHCAMIVTVVRRQRRAPQVAYGWEDGGYYAEAMAISRGARSHTINGL